MQIAPPIVILDWNLAAEMFGSIPYPAAPVEPCYTETKATIVASRNITYLDFNKGGTFQLPFTYTV